MKRFLRKTAAVLLGVLYRVNVHNKRNFPPAGQGALIVANHLSLLDAALLTLFLPGKIHFAINTYIAQKWWVKPFLHFVDTFSIDPSNPMSMKRIITLLKEGEKCVIFPEGRITVTGALMKVYEGPGVIADKAGVPLCPVRIDGAQYTPFSYLKGKVRTRWFPQISMTVLPPVSNLIPEGVKGKARRRAAGDALHKVMVNMIFETSPYKKTLLESLTDARRVHGGSHVAMIDIKRGHMTYRKMLQGAFALGALFAKKFTKGEHVGVLMPNVNGTAAVFFGLHAAKAVPAMLNYTGGAAHMKAACEAAKVKHIVTSQAFIETAKLEQAANVLEEAGYELIYLENMRGEIDFSAKIAAVLKTLAARFVTPAAAKADPYDTACILFTSGSEGTPKGVALSHVNLQANRFQLAACIDFNPADTVFNALPVFHAFGLTGGFLLPVLGGVRTVIYPSPLHYRVIPELVYEYNATILFGTDTFLEGYARTADPYDFYSLRYVFAGAERVKERTRDIWMNRFGLRILEGYGATECAPGISFNTPMAFKAGTVGKILPGMTFRLQETQSGSDGAGLLHVKGPNVMKGYYKCDNPGVLQPPENGEYDTGDIVRVDEDGFIAIEGRAKRFAKIGGEMVSLTAVEQRADMLWPDYRHAVIAVADEKKGEQLALLTEYSDASRKEMSAFYKKNGFPDLALPRYIHVTEEMPLLGSGKTDYKEAERLVKTMLDA